MAFYTGERTLAISKTLYSTVALKNHSQAVIISLLLLGTVSKLISSKYQ